MNKLEQEAINAAIALHGIRAVSALSFSGIEAAAILRKESKTLKTESQFLNPENSAEILESNPGLYELCASKIMEYISKNFPCTAVTRCFPGDLNQRKEDIYAFFNSQSQEPQMLLPSSQPRSQALQYPS